ncbi:Glycerol-3-phosphate acyltransferase [subsurface metagenome]
MVTEFALLTIGAYLLGSVPAAYLAAKWSRGIDLRQYGTGNVSVGNLWRMFSKRLAIPVVIFDLGKGAAVVWAAQLLGLGVVQEVTVGLAAIIGHNWPVFLRFNGGRGILTTIGVVFLLMPWGIVVILAGALLALLIKTSPLPTLGGIAILPLVSWFFGQPLGIEEPLPVTLGFLAIFLVMIIRRLTAPKSADAVSVSKKQLLLNRLLFDRDIRDREAWLHQASPKASSTEQARLQKKKRKKGLF